MEDPVLLLVKTLMLVGGGGLVLLLLINSRRVSTSPTLLRLFAPIHKKKYLISLQESEVYEILQKIFPHPKFMIWCQVSVASLVDGEFKSLFWGFMNQLKYKSVDYVIVTKNDKGTYKPLLAIELDDKTHWLPYRAARDRYIEVAFEKIELKLFRVKTRDIYLGDDLKAQVLSYLNSNGFKAKIY